MKNFDFFPFRLDLISIQDFPESDPLRKTGGVADCPVGHFSTAPVLPGTSALIANVVLDWKSLYPLGSDGFTLKF